MAIHYRTRGIIFRKTDRGEADRIYRIFTKEFGKLDLWAISVRKIASKLRSGLELFSLCDVEFIQGRTRRVLTDSILVNRYGNLKNDLGKLWLMYRMANELDGLVLGQERDERVWQFLDATLSALDAGSVSRISLQGFLSDFRLNLLSLLGYSDNADKKYP